MRVIFLLIWLSFFSQSSLNASSSIHDSVKERFNAIFANPDAERNNLLGIYSANKDLLPDSTIALIFSQIGISHAVQASYDSALYYFNTAIELVPLNSSPYFRFQNNIANVYRNSGKLKQALAIYYEILPHVQEIDPDFTYYIYSSMASVLRLMNLKNEALDYLLKTIETLESIESTGKFELALEYQKLANTYFSLERHD